MTLGAKNRWRQNPESVQTPSGKKRKRFLCTNQRETWPKRHERNDGNFTWAQVFYVILRNFTAIILRRNAGLPASNHAKRADESHAGKWQTPGRRQTHRGKCCEQLRHPLRRVDNTHPKVLPSTCVHVCVFLPHTFRGFPPLLTLGACVRLHWSHTYRLCPYLFGFPPTICYLFRFDIWSRSAVPTSSLSSFFFFLVPGWDKKMDGAPLIGAHMLFALRRRRGVWSALRSTVGQVRGRLSARTRDPVDLAGYGENLFIIFEPTVFFDN